MLWDNVKHAGERATETILDIFKVVLEVNRAAWDCVLVNKIVLEMESSIFV